MIDEKKLIREMWDRYNGHYNNASRFSKEETEMANRVLSDFQKAIDRQPEVGQWIPVSERLPIKELEKERSERGKNAIYPVMVTAKVFSYEENKKIIIVKKAFYMEYEGRLFFSDTDGNEVEVVAWMPLPPAYKEGE